MTQFYRQNGGQSALNIARRETGQPYLFGGNPPGPADCSGLTEWAYESVGVNLPRTTYAQYLVSQIPDSDAYEPGDLIFIEGSDPGPDGEPGHVMIYVSPGQVFQAPFTGELIGQYPYDTTSWEFRTRPALALPLWTAPVPTPGSPASKVPITLRPLYDPPDLIYANPDKSNQAWDIYLRRLLDAAKVSHFLHVIEGQYGVLTRNAVVRWQRKWNLTAPKGQGVKEDGNCMQDTWRTLGVIK